MAEQNIQIRQGQNFGEVTGILSEKNLQLLTGSITGNDGKDIPCETIRGSIVLDTGNDNLVTINIYMNSKTKSGSDKRQFAGFNTIMREAISAKEISVGKISFKTGTTNMAVDKMQTVEIAIPPTVVEPNKLTCKVSLNVQDYFNVGKNEMITKVEPSLIKANRVPMETENKAVIAVEGVVLGIKDEIENEEETGRKIMNFIHIGYQGVVTPIEAIVEKEKFGVSNWADKFVENFPVGTSCELSFEFTSKQVGSKKVEAEEVFMGQVADVTSGYSKPELIFIGAKRPFEEDQVDKDGVRMAYTREEVQQVMNERKITLEAKEADGKAKAKKPNVTQNSISAKKQVVSDAQAMEKAKSWF